MTAVSYAVFTAPADPAIVALVLAYESTICNMPATEELPDAMSVDTLDDTQELDVLLHAKTKLLEAPSALICLRFTN